MACQYLGFQASLNSPFKRIDELLFKNFLVDRWMEARAVVIKRDTGDSSLCMSAVCLRRLFDAGILSICIELHDHISMPRLRRFVLMFLTPVESDSQPSVILRVGPHTATILSISYIFGYP